MGNDDPGGMGDSVRLTLAFDGCKAASPRKPRCCVAVRIGLGPIRTLASHTIALPTERGTLPRLKFTAVGDLATVVR